MKGLAPEVAAERLAAYIEAAEHLEARWRDNQKLKQFQFVARELRTNASKFRRRQNTKVSTPKRGQSAIFTTAYETDDELSEL